MTKLLERLCILTCMLCPDREIVHLYTPKARNALEMVEGAVFTDDDIEMADKAVDANYDSYKETADTLKDDKQYKTLVTYVDEHYHNLQIGKCYTWEEICRECPYRFVFLSSGYIDDYGRIVDGVFEGAATPEDESKVYVAIKARGSSVNIWKWTCGRRDKGVYVYVF